MKNSSNSKDTQFARILSTHRCVNLNLLHFSSISLQASSILSISIFHIFSFVCSLNTVTSTRLLTHTHTYLYIEQFAQQQPFLFVIVAARHIQNGFASTRSFKPCDSFIKPSLQITNCNSSHFYSHFYLCYYYYCFATAKQRTPLSMLCHCLYLYAFGAFNHLQPNSVHILFTGVYNFGLLRLTACVQAFVLKSSIYHIASYRPSVHPIMANFFITRSVCPFAF